jgi:hypothetical protein
VRDWRVEVCRRERPAAAEHTAVRCRHGFNLSRRIRGMTRVPASKQLNSNKVKNISIPEQESLQKTQAMEQGF